MLTATKLNLDHRDDRRWDGRDPIGFPSTLRTAGRPSAEVIVDDLSRNGFAFGSRDPLAVGTVVQVGLAGAGTASATVVWRDRDRHGCAFLKSLSSVQLAAAFSNDTLVHGLFAHPEAIVVPEPVVAKWPRPLRALTWMIGGSAPWLVLAALRLA